MLVSAWSKDASIKYLFLKIRMEFNLMNELLTATVASLFVESEP